MWRNPKDFEHIGKMAREWAKNMRPEDFERLRERAREVEKMSPSPQQMESLRQQAQLLQEMFSDPKVRQAHADMARMLEQRNSALVHMPDAATQQRLLEAARYFNSEEFRAGRHGLMQLAQTARQRLGTEGLAAAQRIATRQTATNGGQEQALERIKAGQVEGLLEEATQLRLSQS